ncbi:MAG: DEAD/DEAH box helicase family protein [Candidatus Sumerlaeota bacterium]|nr:DEAD/DEAH box helicase family protein [Candidatus Sumerlaeota bacterium]
MLTDLPLLPVYDSADCDIVRDLQVPLLKESVEYWRGVGFFTSGWLRLAAQGICGLVENGGRVRIVAAPILEIRDWEALQLGDSTRHDDALRFLLDQRITQISESLESDTLNCLAWMVADDVLEFRFAVARAGELVNDYHDKVGYFVDSAGDEVAIHGSFNDTLRAVRNGEAFSVFKSWEPGQRPYVENHRDRLKALWRFGNRQFRIYQIPAMARERLIRLRSSRTRPYDMPSVHPAVPVAAAVTMPVALRPYQEEAIAAWDGANRRGILEMATGTGKTTTALAAALRLATEKRLALVIFVPFIHLLEQWQRNCQAFGWQPILCSGEHDSWDHEARSAIQDFNLRAVRTICLLVVQQTRYSNPESLDSSPTWSVLAAF